MLWGGDGVALLDLPMHMRRSLVIGPAGTPWEGVRGVTVCGSLGDTNECSSIDGLSDSTNNCSSIEAWRRRTPDMGKRWDEAKAAVGIEWIIMGHYRQSHQFSTAIY